MYTYQWIVIIIATFIVAFSLGAHFHGRATRKRDQERLEEFKQALVEQRAAVASLKNEDYYEDLTADEWCELINEIFEAQAGVFMK